MKQNEPVAKIMSTELKSVHVEQKVSDARRLLADNPFDHLPVLSGKKLVGMLSSRDLLRVTFDAKNTDTRSTDAVLDNSFTIAGIMKTSVATIKSSDTIRHAAELLAKGDFDSLPVVEDSGDVVGIVTTTDLIRYLVDQY
ncbi:MAG TPA: CBS domain-containing protein [Steroidobacteraceae bacterium]|nr:CBS domain-containing protein [Steroidobacteraceae bacterium]HRX91156.1 CBS domain-containing protein [Steroidobacteraceae bacterium]